MWINGQTLRICQYIFSKHTMQLIVHGVSIQFDAIYTIWAVSVDVALIRNC